MFTAPRGWLTERKIQQITFTILLAVLVLHSVYYIPTAYVAYDEPYYLYTARLTAQDLAKPFLDFRTKYPPVSYYVQVAIQSISEPSFILPRLLSTFFLYITVFLSYLLVKRISGAWAALVVLGLYAFHPFLLPAFTSGLPYSLTAMFSIGSVWFLFNNRLSPMARIIVASLFMSCAVLTRYNMLPALFLIILFCGAYWRKFSYVTVAVFVSLATIALGMVPYFLIDAEYAFATALAMFGPIAKIVPIEYLADSPFTREGVGTAFSHPLLRTMAIVSTMGHFAGMTLIFLVGLFFQLFKPGEKNNLGDEEHFSHPLILTLVIAIVLGAAHYIFGQIISVMYANYFAPFIIVAVALAVGPLLNELLKRDSAVPHKVRVGTVLLLTGLVVMPFVQKWGVMNNAELVKNYSERQTFYDTDISRIEKGAGLLKSLTEKSDIIATTDHPYHAYAADRFEIPELVTTYEYRINASPGHLERYNLYDYELLLWWLENQATVAVFQRGSLPTAALRIAPDRVHGAVEGIEAVLEEKYTLVGSAPNVYPKYDKIGLGIMDVYRRIK